MLPRGSPHLAHPQFRGRGGTPGQCASLTATALVLIMLLYVVVQLHYLTLYYLLASLQEHSEGFVMR